jgi:uncharacterized membrane protein SpoIIM required for sporulation
MIGFIPAFMVAYRYITPQHVEWVGENEIEPEDVMFMFAFSFIWAVFWIAWLIPAAVYSIIIKPQLKKYIDRKWGNK